MERTERDLRQAEEKFYGLVEDAWYYETKGELNLTEDPDLDLVELVRAMEASAREYIDNTATEQMRPGYGGAPVVIEEMTEEEIARRIAVCLATLWWGVS